jgi:hypothetical protein
MWVSTRSRLNCNCKLFWITVGSKVNEVLLREEAFRGMLWVDEACTYLEPAHAVSHTTKITLLFTEADMVRVCCWVLFYLSEINRGKRTICTCGC